MLAGALSLNQIYIYRYPTDMRKGFDGLSGLVNNELEKSPVSGDAFIFFNRRLNLLKLLVWEKGGFGIYYKRLEQGTFEIPEAKEDEKAISISQTELLFILEGIDLKAIKKRKRYSLKNWI